MINPIDLGHSSGAQGASDEDVEAPADVHELSAHLVSSGDHSDLSQPGEDRVHSHTNDNTGRAVVAEIDDPNADNASPAKGIDASHREGADQDKGKEMEPHGCGHGAEFLARHLLQPV